MPPWITDGGAKESALAVRSVDKERKRGAGKVAGFNEIDPQRGTIHCREASSATHCW